MAVHSIRIESNAAQCIIEIRSAATWARAPGHVLMYGVDGERVRETTVEIDDRTIQLKQTTDVLAQLRLVVQVATNEDALSLTTGKSSDGILRLTSAVNTRVNDRHGEEDNQLDVVLFLNAMTAETAGAMAGDPSLRSWHQRQ